MDDDLAVVESQEVEPTEDSSDDLRTALTSAIKEVSERPRDDQGRFAEKPIEAPETSTPTESTTAVQKAATEAVTALPEASEPVAHKAPDAWSPQNKAQFATLPAWAQEEVSKREAEVHKGFTRQDEQRALGKSFEQVVSPYLPLIRSEGGNPIAAVQDLLQTAYTLRTGSPDAKQQLFLGLAQQFGVDLNGVFQRITNAPVVDPQVAQLRQQLMHLQQQVEQPRQLADAQENAQIATTIEGFASDPKNVYFANVKPEMAALLRDGRAKDLQEAYDMACWARPDIRPLMLQQQEQHKAAEVKAKATQARSAAVSISGSPATGARSSAVTNPGASIADDIRAAMREVNGRI